MQIRASLTGLVLALSAGVAAQASPQETANPSASETQAKTDAKAKFIKKCIRNMTKQSCTAPQEARNPSGA